MVKADRHWLLVSTSTSFCGAPSTLDSTTPPSPFPPPMVPTLTPFSLSLSLIPPLSTLSRASSPRNPSPIHCCRVPPPPDPPPETPPPSSSPPPPPPSPIPLPPSVPPCPFPGPASAPAFVASAARSVRRSPECWEEVEECGEEIGVASWPSASGGWRWVIDAGKGGEVNVEVEDSCNSVLHAASCV